MVPSRDRATSVLHNATSLLDPRLLAPFEIFTLVGALFFAICYAGSWLSRRLESRLSRAAPAGETEWRYRLGVR